MWTLRVRQTRNNLLTHHASLSNHSCSTAAAATDAAFKSLIFQTQNGRHVPRDVGRGRKNMKFPYCWEKSLFRKCPSNSLRQLQLSSRDLRADKLETTGSHTALYFPTTAALLLQRRSQSSFLSWECQSNSPGQFEYHLPPCRVFGASTNWPQRLHLCRTTTAATDAARTFSKFRPSNVRLVPRHVGRGRKAWLWSHGKESDSGPEMMPRRGVSTWRSNGVTE